MNEDVTSVWTAIMVSSVAVLIWIALLIRMAKSFGCHSERRPFMMAMPVVGLVAAVGTLASGIGFGISSGVIDLDIPKTTLTLVASMGRGALLMGGAIALAYYHPAESKAP